MGGVSLAFKLLGSEPCVSHPYKQQSVDSGSHSSERIRIGLGTKKAESWVPARSIETKSPGGGLGFCLFKPIPSSSP